MVYKKQLFITLMITNLSTAMADCTPKDLTDPDYLIHMGKEKLIDHFKEPRDQDGVGWCGAYAPADSLSFSVGEPVSAVDISINTYANDKDSRKLQKLSGISPLSATDVAKTNGYCPESVIPSDQTSSSNLGHYALTNLMEAFQTISEDYKAKGKPKDYCVKCANDSYDKVIAPSLPNVTTDMIRDVLVKYQGDSLAGFRALLMKLCEGKRVIARPKTEFIYKSSIAPKKISSVIDQALDSDSMPSIGMNTVHFASLASVPGGHGDHEMMIVARRMGANGKCEYQVRNSWGRSCSYYIPEVKDKCDPEKGSFWMDTDQIEKGVSDVLIVKNNQDIPKIPFKPEDSSTVVLQSEDKKKKQDDHIYQIGEKHPVIGQVDTDQIQNHNQDQPIINPPIDNKIEPKKDDNSPLGDIKKAYDQFDFGKFIQSAVDVISSAVTSIWQALSNYFKY